MTPYTADEGRVPLRDHERADWLHENDREPNELRGCVTSLLCPAIVILALALWLNR